MLREKHIEEVKKCPEIIKNTFQKLKNEDFETKVITNLKKS